MTHFNLNVVPLSTQDKDAVLDKCNNSSAGLTNPSDIWIFRIKLCQIDNFKEIVKEIEQINTYT